MSVDNLTILHTAAFAPYAMANQLERPQARNSLPHVHQLSPSSATSDPSPGLYDHRPKVQHSQSFTLPPIRELLKDAPPAPVRSASASLSSTPASSSTMAQPTPLPHQIPSLHQMPSPQYQPYHMNSNTSSPQHPQVLAHTHLQQPQPQPQPHPLGRSSSLPNYLAHYGGRVPSPYQAHGPQGQSQYPIHNMHIPNMMPTPESRSESASPIHREMMQLPSLYGEANKESKLSSRKKRQNLPRQTTLILLSWLSEHLDRPYPNSREKYDLLMKTRLTIQQLDNWFINARRRKITELRKLKENDQSIALMF